MNAAKLLLAALLLGACAAPVAQLSDDAAPTMPLEERVQALRSEVEALVGQPTLSGNSDALTRMRGWLDAMAESSEDDAEIFEQAVRAQLEYLRTSELLRYANQGAVQ